MGKTFVGTDIISQRLEPAARPTMAALVKNSHHNALPNDHRINWYVIDKVLGVGGFGITYLAHDANLDQKVAIKEYLPVQLATRSSDSSIQPLDQNKAEDYRWGLRRFISEAQTIAKFDHPNIVRVNSVFESNNTAYMVMRYEDGKNLNEIIKHRRTLDEDQLLAILVPILNGLERVHNTGFIHRDIKPSNIFIRRDGTPVLLDFGSARQALGHETRTLTSLVSPGYAPYEQYSNELTQQGPWTDIYALGATMYRLMTGVAPIDALDRSKAFLRDQQDSLVGALEAGEGRYSPRFLMGVDHALAFKEEDRPQTIAEWRRDFGLADDEEVPTVPGILFDVDDEIDHEAPTMPSPVSSDATIAVPHGRSTGAGTRPRRRRRRAWRLQRIAAAAAGSLALLAAGAWIFGEPLLQIYRDRADPAAGAELAGADPGRAPTAVTAEGLEQRLLVNDLLNQAEESRKPLSLSGPNYRQALAHYQSVLEIEPDNTQAQRGVRDVVALYVEQARLSLDNEDFDDAERSLREALEGMPNEPALLDAMAEVDTRRAAWQAARERQIAEWMASAQQALDEGRVVLPRDDCAFGFYRQVLQLDADHAGARSGIQRIPPLVINKARSLANAGDYEHAFDVVDEARRLLPESSELVAFRDALLQRDAGQQESPPATAATPEQPAAPPHEPELFRDTLADGTPGPLLARIPAGSFQMGDGQGVGENDERPAIDITLQRGYAMTVYEITFEDYDLFAERTGRAGPDDRGWGRGKRPVISISWDDARAYAAWLSTQTGQRYRLPSEAEWEYAARAGTQTVYPWGDEFLPNRANCEGCGSAWDGRKTAPVGSFPANSFGLHDMTGNVYEWTQDCWNVNHAAAPTDGRPRLRGQCGNRVRRGGSYIYGVRDVRPANRDRFPPIRASDNTGFRLVREIGDDETLKLSTAP